jgi:hypothetical protein
MPRNPHYEGMMPMRLHRLFPIFLLYSLPLPAAELAVLAPATWDGFAAAGKEADGIYGDLVLRNERILAVVGEPTPHRRANMAVARVGGALVDFTLRDAPNDQLTIYHPGGGDRVFRFVAAGADDTPGDPAKGVLRGRRVWLTCVSDAAPGQPALEITYTLADGAEHLLVETVHSNPGAEPLTVPLVDRLRAEHSFDKTPDGWREWFWAYDPWFGQAYGVTFDGHRVDCVSDRKLTMLHALVNGEKSVVLPPGGSRKLVRRLFPARHLLEAQAVAARLGGRRLDRVVVRVRDWRGPREGAEVVVNTLGVHQGWGRTGPGGEIAFDVPPGRYEILGRLWRRGGKPVEADSGAGTPVEIVLDDHGWVAGMVTDGAGAPIPAKVQFRGRDGTPDPELGHETGDHAVRDLYYCHNGAFEIPIPAGRYNVIVSFGPEYDAAFTTLDVTPGTIVPLRAALKRSVDTPGWISADFHGHSSPSGDNASSQRGRVLNLLCEQIEFAPCTEHNRLSTYAPHLRALGAERWMATCTGIELSGHPGTVNHQNAFPLVLTERVQDGGAPGKDDSDPVAQIRRLALWDDGSEKFVQGNHPDIVQILWDRDKDGKRDGGYAEMLDFMDVIEVHPLGDILDPGGGGRVRRWLQLLNLGHRLPGVVNSDAHINYHDSAFWRNYVRSPTDDPARIRVMDIVHASERGNLVMTSGPFLEVGVRPEGVSDGPVAVPGMEVALPGGRAALRVRVQCANWLDVNRVQVLVNGRPDPAANFTRASTPDRFGDGVVKFDREILLAVAGDAHVIVVAIGEGLTLGPVTGPRWGHLPPVAVSNPIWLDVDGGGFKANGDLLDLATPKEE